MSKVRLAVFLHQIPFLKEVDQDGISNVIEHLERRIFAPGEVIIQQGSPVKSLFLLFEGKVEAIQNDAHGSKVFQAEWSKGDLFGELELIYGEPSRNTVRAIETTTIYLWPLTSLVPFLKAHSSSWASLKFSARSRRMAEKLRFKWLGEGESIQGLARKHPILLVRALTLPLLFLGGVTAMGIWAVSGGSSLIAWLAIGLAVVSLAFSAWRWIDWSNDFYIVTNRRAVWLEKVVGIYDRRQETPLHWVLSVSVSTDILGRSFGYGDVIIRTYTGQLAFRNIGDPYTMAAVVEEHWRRMKESRKVSDREEMVHTLQERLSMEGEQELLPEVDVEREQGDGTLEEAGSQIGLDQWTFKMRFEEQGVITYRKHWAVLLRQIAVPTIAILLLLGFLGMRLSGLFPFFTASQALLGSFLVLIPLVLWWIYRYLDWANDIYQITPTQIIDVNKKPLARELRKVAPLENILGTEVDRKGLIGLLLNYGSVITNVGTSRFIFHGVYDPAGVQQDIVRAQDAFLERQRESERRQRQEEVVEWLSAYHDEISQQGREPEEGNE
jgi:hypothetical protein